MVETISNGILEVSIKSLGAEMTSIKTLKDGVEFLWQGDPEYWAGQAYNLFPIIGGIPDDKYTLGGKEYFMKSHGFARKMEFKVSQKTASEISCKLSYNEETYRQYPYKFDLMTSYILKENCLIQRYKVVNLDEKQMLFSIGAHPGFNCPLFPGEKMSDYYIAFEKPDTLNKRIKAGGLLTGEKERFMDGESILKLEHNLFYKGAAILDNVASNWLEIRSRANDRRIRVDFQGFPYLGIWSSANDGPYVCIEPWYGIDSAVGDSYEFEKKEGLQRLDAGKTFECQYKITIS